MHRWRKTKKRGTRACATESDKICRIKPLELAGSLNYYRRVFFFSSFVLGLFRNPATRLRALLAKCRNEQRSVESIWENHLNRVSRGDRRNRACRMRCTPRVHTSSSWPLVGGVASVKVPAYSYRQGDGECHSVPHRWMLEVASLPAQDEIVFRERFSIRLPAGHGVVKRVLHLAEMWRLTCNLLEECLKFRVISLGVRIKADSHTAVQ